MQTQNIAAAVLLGVIYITTVCSKKTKIRLSGGKGSHEGNVEVFFKGEWKYVCDDYWDLRDAKVVCRQLGFTKSLNATTKSHFKVIRNASYWLDNVQCWGSEQDIDHCWHRHLGWHNCEKLVEAAGVVCSDIPENDKKFPTPSASSGEEGKSIKVRLQGQTKDGFISDGYLEIFYNKTWHPVCADKWTDPNSFVACGNLGYHDVDKDGYIPKKKDYTPEKKYIMSRVYCMGTESTLTECEHAGFHTKHICKSQAVYINCKRSPFIKDNRFDKVSIGSHVVRIRAGSRHSEGRIEVLHEGRWGTICDDGWNIVNANIFCRQMGFGSAFEATHYASFGLGSGKVWLDQVSCTDNEKDIRNCSHLKWGQGDCGHQEDAGVKCHFPYKKEEFQMRLSGGAKKHIGRVEILSDGQWKAVCGIRWGVREAEVACRQLGLGYARRGFSSSKYGLTRQIALFSVKCSGDELSLTHCHHKTRQSGGKCRYYDMAVVECSLHAPDLVMDYREMQKSLQVESKPLFELSCAYEENCLSSTAAHYIHYPHYFSRTLIRFTSRFYNRGTESFRPNVKKSDWEWHSCHRHYHSMERFTDYDLIDSKNIKRAEGHKASFCLEDSKCDKGVSKFYNCTNAGDQGISVGCADNYKFNIDCQWIDVTDLEYGKYKLRVILNPFRKVVESDYSNNIVTCDIDFIGQDRINATACYIEPCEQMSHGGTADGACCKFPFNFKGKQYHHCTTDGLPEGKTLWCATTSNYDKDKLWGTC